MGYHPCYYQDQMTVSINNIDANPQFAVRWSEDGDPALQGKRTSAADAELWGADLFNVGTKDNDKLVFIQDRKRTVIT